MQTDTIVMTAAIGGYDFKMKGGNTKGSGEWSSDACCSDIVTDRSTTDNTCVSSATPLTVNAVPAVPVAPTASVTIQPTCAIPTGTIVITAPTGAYEYSLDGGAFQASATFTGVAPGLHNVTDRSTTDNTCVSSATPLSVNAEPAVPVALIAGVQMCAPPMIPTGTIVITAPTGAYEYSLDGGAFQASATFTGVAPRSEERRVGKESRSRWSPYPSKQNVNAVPDVPVALTATVTIQPTCAIPTG